MENTSVKKGAHLSMEERRMIAILTSEGKSPYAIGKLLGRASNTIRNELKRGTTKMIKGYFEYEGYFADTGQAVYEKNRKKCRKPKKIETCKEYISYIEKEVLKNKRSFASARAQALDTELFTEDQTCSIGTLYIYVEKGLLAVRNIDLPEKVRQKPKRIKRDRQHKRLHGESIEKRPEKINEREEFGHWEIDLVIGKKSGKDRVLLTLTERKTRMEIVRKISGKTVRAVERCIKGLKKEISHFDLVFKTITTDNGSEFAKLGDVGKRLGIEVYYAHPYSSWERGSNENGNKIIRRFVRKGTPIRDYTKKQIQEIEDWINTMYRKVLGWKTAKQCYEEEVKKLLKEAA